MNSGSGSNSNKLWVTEDFSSKKETKETRGLNVIWCLVWDLKQEKDIR